MRGKMSIPLAVGLSVAALAATAAPAFADNNDPKAPGPEARRAICDNLDARPYAYEGYTTVDGSPGHWGVLHVEGSHVYLDYRGEWPAVTPVDIWCDPPASEHDPHASDPFAG